METGLFTLVVATTLFAVACGSDSGEVASLQVADAETDVTEDSTTDVETSWLEFTECLRDNGLDVTDPIFDGDKIVEKPEPIGGAAASKKELDEAYKVCGELLVGATLEKEKGDQTEYVDGLLELAVCLRDQGIDVDDPDMSAEDPGQAIGSMLKKDWESPAMQKAREACDVNAAFGVTK